MRWFGVAFLFAFATQSLADDVTIVGVNVVDVKSGEVTPDRVVDIVQGRIERIIPSDEFSGQTSSKLVTAEGKYLIPGLWDSHTHVFGDSPERTLPLFVAYGVTHVRDLGSTMTDVKKGVFLIKEGTLVTAPKVITTGPLLDSVKQSWYGDLQIVVKSAGDVENVLKNQDTDQLKVYTNLEPEAYKAVLEWGARNGRPVAGHVPIKVGLNGNPLDDINAVADPVGVYTGGAWLDRSALMEIRARSQFANLEGLRWEYRVILIFAREPFLSNALSNLDELKAEIEERDIAWFVLGDNTMHTNYDGRLEDKLHEELMDSYFTPVPAETAVRLIGKDGTVKSRSIDLDLEATFGLIDRMPMRREEMRRKSDDSD